MPTSDAQTDAQDALAALAVRIELLEKVVAEARKLATIPFYSFQSMDKSTYVYGHPVNYGVDGWEGGLCGAIFELDGGGSTRYVPPSQQPWAIEHRKRDARNARRRKSA